ncbi:MAG: glycosyltransferase [Acidobacteria bacterium]|nr:glycosyltransferase [Acidobacteriota bacterium]
MSSDERQGAGRYPADEWIGGGSGVAAARGGAGAAGVSASVSVVVPSFNHARFVPQALRSIFRQTRAPAELLVIDDGSADGSPQVIERELKDCPFPCELIARANRGLCATLNEGLARAARGRYFAYLGSDDLWLADFLAARVAALEARPRAALAYGHAYLIDAGGRVVDCTADWAAYADGDARAMLLETTAPMSPTVLYRRDALAREAWDERARLEDYDLYLRLAAAHDFAFDPRPLSAWRRHGENASRDQRMMLDEQLAAQRRRRGSLDVSARELERLHARIRFARAEDFLRLGRKADALRLALSNLPGARSPRTIARLAARFLIPFPLVRAHKRRVARRAAERYGQIQV